MPPDLKAIDDEARWQAVLSHDAQADGKFVFAVRTTGVFCRPSCRSRTPLRKNVSYYNSIEDAQRAGFRPCKRCQPDGDALKEYYAARVAAACRTIESSEQAPGLKELARAAGMSHFHFQRVFKKVAGLTPKAYALARRADRVRFELCRRNSVTEAIYEAGFNSNGRFYAGSSDLLGMKPTRFRQGGKGETIRFAVSACSLGSILIALSKKGICAISMGDKPDKLFRDLQNTFPKARLIGGGKEFERLVSRVIAFVEAPKLGLDLPLDIRGTAFQRRVWKALLQIPFGSTATYSEVARKIGSPRASRAVGHACATNSIAVAVPCHRVLRTDGQLSGYRWGMKRKRTLLQREASTRPRTPIL
jgi:AraC family transcriptional regulator of adaptative response/methylated-DNA-[protein]-cysteine methyltransferase